MLKKTAFCYQFLIDHYWGEYTTLLTKVFWRTFLSTGHQVTYSSNLDETLASFKMSTSYQKKICMSNDKSDQAWEEEQNGFRIVYLPSNVWTSCLISILQNKKSVQILTQSSLNFFRSPLLGKGIKKIIYMRKRSHTFLPQEFHSVCHVDNPLCRRAKNLPLTNRFPQTL